MPAMHTRLPARFSPVGRVLFANSPAINMVISIIGDINAAFVRLSAVTAFSPRRPSGSEKKTASSFSTGIKRYNR